MPGPGTRFRAALAAESPLQCVGAINACYALLAQSSGFQALYLSGGGVAAGSCGIPDLGITTMEDVLIDLRAAVARLPRKQRLAVVLFAIEGYSHREAAAMTGMTVAASKVQLHLGKRRLRVELER